MYDVLEFIMNVLDNMADGTIEVFTFLIRLDMDCFQSDDIAEICVG